MLAGCLKRKHEQSPTFARDRKKTPMGALMARIFEGAAPEVPAGAATAVPEDAFIGVQPTGVQAPPGFVFGDTLGRGSFGVVYKGDDCWIK